MDGRRAAQEVHHALVVVDAIQWRGRRIAPTVILEQFSSTGKERSQIGIHVARQTTIELIRAREFRVEVERSVIPAWILEQQVFEDAAWIAKTRAGDHMTRLGRVAPHRFSPPRIAGVDEFFRAGIDEGIIELPDQFDLRSREAIGAILVGTLYRLGIEVAACRILQDAVCDAVASVARGKDSGVKNRKLRRRDQRTGASFDGQTVPDSLCLEVCEPVRRRADDNPIEVRWKSLRFRQPLSSAERTAIPIRESRRARVI